MKAQFSEFERLSKVIERIAHRHDEKSEEYQALKTATYALFFALTEHNDEFKKFSDGLESPLTESEKKHLEEL